MAQSDATIDDGTATITVVEGSPGDIVVGASSSPARPWPYTCSWFTLIGGSDIDSFRTTRPQVGGRHRLICNPRAGFTNPVINVITIYNPADPVPGENVITTVELVRAAQDALRPDPLYLGISPDDVQITGVETWLWPDGTIAKQGVSATAGGLTATVEARYLSTTFHTGEDGVEVQCTTQTIWTSGATSSPCTHTYLTEASARPVRVESRWQFVWWDNAGQPGAVDLGIEAYDEFDTVEVIDLEAVISRSD